MSPMTNRGLVLMEQPGLRSLSDALTRGDEAALHTSLLALVAQHGTELSSVLAPALAPLLIQSARLSALDVGDSRFEPADCDNLLAARRSLRRMSAATRFDSAVAFVFFDGQTRLTATIECVFNEPSVPAVTLFDYERPRTDGLHADMTARLESVARAFNVSFVVRVRWGGQVVQLSDNALAAVAVAAHIAANLSEESLPRWVDVRGCGELGLRRLPSDVRIAIADESTSAVIPGGWRTYNPADPRAGAAHLGGGGSVVIRSDDPDAIAQALRSLTRTPPKNALPIAVAV